MLFSMKIYINCGTNALAYFKKHPSMYGMIEPILETAGLIKFTTLRMEKTRGAYSQNFFS